MFSTCFSRIILNPFTISSIFLFKSFTTAIIVVDDICRNDISRLESLKCQLLDTSFRNLVNNFFQREYSTFPKETKHNCKYFFNMSYSFIFVCLFFIFIFFFAFIQIFLQPVGGTYRHWNSQRFGISACVVVSGRAWARGKCHG